MVTGVDPIRKAPARALLLLFIFACGPAPSPQPEQLEHRLHACRQICESRFAAECDYAALCATRYGSDCEEILWSQFDGAEDCVESCATPTGDAAYGWGYQMDGKDACIPEMEANAECFAKLSCEDKLTTYAGVAALPESERPCWETTKPVLDCQTAHPYEQGK